MKTFQQLFGRFGITQYCQTDSGAWLYRPSISHSKRPKFGKWCFYREGDELPKTENLTAVQLSEKEIAVLAEIIQYGEQDHS